jgi:ADP-ribosyl-[dinitrogen reductase] hydrolase
VQWHDDGLWTPHGEVFDVGIATRQAIGRLRAGVDPLQAGGRDEYSNGNGSLMRIAPLLYHIKDMDVEERWQLTSEVSSITHGHLRSVIGCFYFLEFARYILMGMDKFSGYAILKPAMKTFLVSRCVDAGEVAHFSRLLDGNIHELPEKQIMSSGYVVHTLEASVWSVLTTGSYTDAVLRAVNLGDDTDTTGAVTGALAGLLYGYETIPQHWVEVLARREDILVLAAAIEK